MPKEKKDLSPDEAANRLFELHERKLKLCAGPHNMNDAIDPILDLLRQGNILQAQESLEGMKLDAGKLLSTLWCLIREYVETIHEQEMEIANLRVKIIEGAIKYAELNEDPESIAIGHELMSKQTFFVAAAIANLDPDR
jgi:hypothetical protein